MTFCYNIIMIIKIILFANHYCIQLISFAGIKQIPQTKIYCVNIMLCKFNASSFETFDSIMIMHFKIEICQLCAEGFSDIDILTHDEHCVSICVLLLQL